MSSLSEENSNAAVIVDDVHLIHRLPFTCGETFQEVSDRFLQALILDITEGTSSIHFCYDRYDHYIYQVLTEWKGLDVRN